jgi:hypothetical protein
MSIAATGATRPTIGLAEKLRRMRMAHTDADTAQRFEPFGLGKRATLTRLGRRSYSMAFSPPRPESENDDCGDEQNEATLVHAA